MDEQNIISESASILRSYGDAFLEPLTGGGQGAGYFRSDLVFVPREGPNAGVPHIVEFKKWNGKSLPSAIISGGAYHIDMVKSKNPYYKIRTALSSNAKVKDSWATKLRGRNIYVIDGVRNPTSLADSVIEWANSRDA